MTSPTPHPQSTSASDLTSLFGAEPTPSLPASNPSTQTSPASREAQLSSLRTRPIPRPPRFKEDKNPELTSLRHQLELLLAENLITERIRQAKSAIIQRIRVLEGEEARRVEDGKKAKLRKEGLPEPVEKGEKEKLMASAKKVARAKAPGVRSQKRKKAIDEYDMDGEERLRLGLEVKNKKRKTKAGGKWFSDLYGTK